MSKKTGKTKRKAPQVRVSEPRNPLFSHPLMKKSHAHVKSNKAKRRAGKVRDSRDWYSQSGFIETVLAIPFQPVSIANS